MLREKNIRIVMSPPTRKNLEAALAQDYIPICHVNQKVIRGEPGYEAHSVLVLSCNQHYAVVHNPGPPPVASQKLAVSTFEKAWSSPSEKLKTLFAIGERS